MPPFLCAISHFSKKYHNQVALAKRPFVAGHTEDKYTGCDVFAEKASFKCSKISITMFAMTLKMTVMLLSSRYRREIKDSRKRRSEMKKKFRERAIAMMVAALIAASPVSGAVFAADEIAVQEQNKPAVSEEMKEEKPEEVNNDALSVENTEAAVSQNEEQAAANSENDNHELAQPERPEASSYEDNDKIEEYNRKVDEYNKAAVNEQNAREDELVRASKEEEAKAVSI